MGVPSKGVCAAVLPDKNASGRKCEFQEDRSRAQTTPNWPEQAEDAFSTMVSNNPNLDTAKSVWPYDEKIENNFNGASISISPNSGLDSDYTG